MAEEERIHYPLLVIKKINNNLYSLGMAQDKGWLKITHWDKNDLEIWEVGQELHGN